VLTVTSPFYIRPLFSAVLYPFQWSAAAVWNGLAGTPAFLAKLANLSKENALLKAENQELKVKQLSFDELKTENNRLRQVLNFNSAYGLRLMPAQVVAKSGSPWFSIVEINKGSKAGIKNNMAVLAEQGLAGKIIEVSLFSSKVLLLNDPESSVAAIDANSRDAGVVAGALPAKLKMKYVGVEGNVKAGDRVITSNLSSLFPPGIPIGVVEKAAKKEHDLFYNIEIKPVVDFLKLEEVYIVL